MVKPIEGFKVIEGNALDKLKLIPSESIDTVFTSPEPPFNYKEMEELWHIMLELPRVLKPSGSIWMQLGDYHNTDGAMTLIPERFLYEMVVSYDWKLRSKLIWHRSSPDHLDPPSQDITATFSNLPRFKRDWEYVYWFVKDMHQYYMDSKLVNLDSSVITTPYSAPRARSFESGFPMDLIQQTAIASTPPHGTILDPFCGTGTTGVVALHSNMNFIGIEVNPRLIPLINKRLEMQQRYLLNTVS